MNEPESNETRSVDARDREDIERAREQATLTFGSQTPPPDRIGSYHILGIIGQGGMGTVYRARQQHPAREVALKLIRASDSPTTRRDLRRRLKDEAELLGRLQHPGIARIYEAGTFGDGDNEQPFFVMELIQGRPLTKYAEENKLTISARLDLFAKICDAVHHAHQKGVIHRDLKPGNVLVTEDGQPKILDFGVARTTDSDLNVTTIETGMARLCGTVPYMSPEQVGGRAEELDTRSDVYALGVVLYELLTGRLPYDLNQRLIHEAVRMIREDEPTRLSSHNSALRGDVDTIVVKAMEKEKDRRYQSAAELGTDVRRYLTDQPIAARPPSAAYQLRKFARRNRAMVAAISAIFAGLVLGVVGLSIGLISAKQARLALVEESERKSTVLEYLGDMLRSGDPDTIGGEVKVVHILNHAADDVGSKFEDQPEVEALVRHEIGSAYVNLGLYEKAEAQYSAALEIDRRLYGDQSHDTLTCMGNVGAAKLMQGKLSEAEPILRGVFETCTTLFGSSHPDTFSAAYNLGVLCSQTGRSDEADRLFQQVLSNSLARYPDQHRQLLRMNGVAGSLMAQDKLPEAESILQDALEIGQRILPINHPRLFRLRANLASIAAREGHLAKAGRSFRSLLDAVQRVRGENHEDALGIMMNYANVLMERNELLEAERLMRVALGRFQVRFGPGDPNTLTCQSNLSVLLQRSGHLADAERLLHETFEIRRGLFGAADRRTLQTMNNLALATHTLGNLADAEELYRDALRIEHGRFPDDDSLVLTTSSGLGALLIDLGRLAEAEKFCCNSLSKRRELLPDSHPHTLFSARVLARLRHKQGKLDAAASLYDETLEALRRAMGNDHPDTLTCMSDFGALLLDAGQAPEAKVLLDEVLRIAPWALPPDHWKLPVFTSAYGDCLCRMGRYQEAEDLLLGAYEKLTALLGEEHPRTGEAVERLVRLYESWGNPDQAARYRATLVGDAAMPEEKSRRFRVAR